MSRNLPIIILAGTVAVAAVCLLGWAVGTYGKPRPACQHQATIRGSEPPVVRIVDPKGAVPPPFTPKLEACHWRGRKAALAGVPSTENPHTDPAERYAWARGYVGGGYERDAKDGKEKP